MMWVEWVEPYVDSDPVYMRVSAQTAVKFMQKAYPGIDPEHALDEFVIVNWATLREEPKSGDTKPE